jgi:hypothetical protein
MQMIGGSRDKRVVIACSSMSHADFRLVYLAISPRGFEALVGSFDTSNSVVRIEISTVGRSFWQSQLGVESKRQIGRNRQGREILQTTNYGTSVN